MSLPKSLNAGLLNQVCCPVTFLPLRQAEEDALARINARIAGGGVKNVGGSAVTEPLTAGLLRADGTLLYPVSQPRPGVLIPRLLADEGIVVEG